MRISTLAFLAVFLGAALLMVSDQAAAVESLPPQAVTTTYLDTFDWRLFAHGSVLELARDTQRQILVITRNYAPEESNTRYAQGGIVGLGHDDTADLLAEALAAAGFEVERGVAGIPSAFCGLTGFKPSTGRVPLDGVFPLSATLDSVGPLAASVACCGDCPSCSPLEVSCSPTRPI